MKEQLGPFFGVVILVVLSAVYFSFYIVPEGKTGVILQFGKPIPPVRAEAGLYLKFPWQEIRLLEKRILNWDGRPTEIITVEKKNIVVDTTARYRIKDPIVFLERLVDLDTAELKITGWLDGATQTVISKNTLVDAVRNTNELLTSQTTVPVADPKDGGQESDTESTPQHDQESAESTAESLETIADEEISGDIEEVTIGREALTRQIIEQAQERMVPFGLELVDVHLKRVALEQSVEQQVFERMKAERERIKRKITSVGQREVDKIRGKVEEVEQSIQSQGYSEVQQIKGDAEATAIQIYADAFGQDPDFFEFVRTIEAYKKGLRSDSQILLSADSPFLKFLTQGATPRP
ncbi:MAG: protease modulator HflC [Bdellovibrionales bacterium]|nr:protease modulator HflC [Bdellovibrionales bacterium]